MTVSLVPLAMMVLGKMSFASRARYEPSITT
jgi:hypothetical protein